MVTAPSAAQFQFPLAPKDLISTIRFQPTSNSRFLVASSWDNSVRLYDASSGEQLSLFEHNAPVLTSCFADAVHTLSGSLDGVFNYFDLNTSQGFNLGRCSRAVSSSLFSQTINAAVSGSWDKSVRIWDTRVSFPTFDEGVGNVGAVSVHKQSDSVFSMDSVNNHLVVATAGSHVLIWDLREMTTPVEIRKSSFRYQTRCLRCFPNGQGYVLSSLDGRVAVSMFDINPSNQNMCYRFQCNRGQEESTDPVKSVNAISFHPLYNTFATGGSDGLVKVWDAYSRTFMAQLEKFRISVTSLDFSDDGTLLSVATSSMPRFDETADPAEPAIFIRRVPDSEVKPVRGVTK